MIKKTFLWVISFISSTLFGYCLEKNFDYLSGCIEKIKEKRQKTVTEKKKKKRKITMTEYSSDGSIKKIEIEEEQIYKKTICK